MSARQPLLVLVSLVCPAATARATLVRAEAQLGGAHQPQPLSLPLRWSSAGSTASLLLPLPAAAAAAAAAAGGSVPLKARVWTRDGAVGSAVVDIAKMGVGQRREAPVRWAARQGGGGSSTADEAPLQPPDVRLVLSKGARYAAQRYADAAPPAIDADERGVEGVNALHVFVYAAEAVDARNARVRLRCRGFHEAQTRVGSVSARVVRWNERLVMRRCRESGQDAVLQVDVVSADELVQHCCRIPLRNLAPLHEFQLRMAVQTPTATASAAGGASLCFGVLAGGDVQTERTLLERNQRLCKVEVRVDAVSGCALDAVFAVLHVDADARTLLAKVGNSLQRWPPFPLAAAAIASNGDWTPRSAGQALATRCRVLPRLEKRAYAALQQRATLFVDENVAFAETAEMALALYAADAARAGAFRLLGVCTLPIRTADGAEAGTPPACVSSVSRGARVAPSAIRVHWVATRWRNRDAVAALQQRGDADADHDHVATPVSPGSNPGLTRSQPDERTATPAAAAAVPTSPVATELPPVTAASRSSSAAAKAEAEKVDKAAPSTATAAAAAAAAAAAPSPVGAELPRVAVAAAAEAVEGDSIRVGAGLRRLETAAAARFKVLHVAQPPLAKGDVGELRHLRKQLDLAHSQNRLQQRQLGEALREADQRLDAIRTCGLEIVELRRRVEELQVDKKQLVAKLREFDALESAALNAGETVAPHQAPMLRVLLQRSRRQLDDERCKRQAAEERVQKMSSAVEKARTTQRNFLKLQDAHAEQAMCIKALQEDKKRTEKFKKTISAQEDVINRLEALLETSIERISLLEANAKQSSAENSSDVRAEPPEGDEAAQVSDTATQERLDAATQRVLALEGELRSAAENFAMEVTALKTAIMERDLQLAAMADLDQSASDSDGSGRSSLATYSDSDANDDDA